MKKSSIVVSVRPSLRGYKLRANGTVVAKCEPNDCGKLVIKARSMVGLTTAERIALLGGKEVTVRDGEKAVTLSIKPY